MKKRIVLWFVGELPLPQDQIGEDFVAHVLDFDDIAFVVLLSSLIKTDALGETSLSHRRTTEEYKSSRRRVLLCIVLELLDFWTPIPGWCNANRAESQAA